MELSFEQLHRECLDAADYDLDQAVELAGRNLCIAGTVIGNIELGYFGGTFKLVRMGDTRNPFGFTLIEGDRVAVREVLAGCYDIVIAGGGFENG